MKDTPNEDTRLYEQDVKDLILEKSHLFIEEEDRHTILFEKGIAVGSTIADCLIFTEDKGIIGIEIKTERDTVRRLNKQLESYSEVCDYVYILCHDDHIEKVEKILDKKYHFIGILSYTVYKGEAILGKYREAIKSPKKRVTLAYQMLWKVEISSILGSFKRQMNTLREKGISVNTARSRQNGLHGLYIKSNASLKYLSKTDMIKMIVSRLGEEEANKLLCNVFINRKMAPEKLLKFHYFKHKP